MSLPLCLPASLNHVHAKLLSRVGLFASPWTVARQAPLSMGFSRQEYWSGLLWPAPGDLRNPGIKPASLKSPALAGGFFTPSASWEASQQTPEVNTQEVGGGSEKN